MIQVLVADQLFATLDTTIRALQPETQPRILISDTVGFIRNLPHDLIASFRSTLDEALDASLLLHIVDASDPAFPYQLEVTRKVLQEIGASHLPTWLILNKIDRLDDLTREDLGLRFSEALQLSALDLESVARLREKIVSFFLSQLTEIELLIPYEKEGLLGEVRKSIHIVEEAYLDAGHRVKIRTDPKTLMSLQRKLAA